MSGTYTLLRSRSSAADFHAREIPAPASCEIWLHELTSPALVLGSSQRDEVVDHVACAGAGVDVVRRRSGGGAVLLIPGDVVWLDVIVPRDAAGWSADVHGPMRWLGGHLAAIVRSRSLVDAGEISTHEGPMRSTPWSTLVCFDGIGAGELLVDGAKLVGISQRRTRDAARLQCCWYTRYDSAELVSLLAEDHRPPVADLAPVATLSVPAARAIPDLLVSALNSALNA